MSPRTSLPTLAVLLLLTPAHLYAGGPPRLNLPIDGVTPDNAQAVSGQLSTKLADKLVKNFGPYRVVEVVPHGDQWYMAFYINEDVRLADVQAALKDCQCKIPCDRLRLFGHVTLEVDPQNAAAEKLLADIKAMKNVTLVSSETNDGRLQITVDMPYPVVEPGKTHRESVGWHKFARNELSSTRPTDSERTIAAKELPTYAAFRDVVAKHKATLKDVRWNTNYACRAVGAVATPSEKTVAATK